MKYWADEQLEQARRDLRMSFALVRQDSRARVPIMAQIRAIDAELAMRGSDG
jgi:hypothetical protein